MRCLSLFHLACTVLLGACPLAAQQQQQVRSAATASSQNGFAVVELFTSEGCSSCPPADAVLEQLAEDYAGRPVLLLEEHVDYWDRLGWKDPFSESLFTQRQNEYAAHWKSPTVYTPQAVVNGRVGLNGAAKEKLQRAVAAALGQRPTALPVILTVASMKNTVQVTYDAALAPNQRLSLLLVQKSATTAVKRGENGGRSLTHHQLVRDWRYATVAKGTTAFSLPDGQPVDGFTIAALVQNPDGQIVAMQQVAP